MTEIDFTNINDTIRQKSVTMFIKELTDESISRNLEKEIYNLTLQKAKDKFITPCWGNQLFKQLYLSKVISIFTNISKICINNTLFKQKIIEGTIPVSSISTMSIYDIFPENWQYLLDAKLKRDKVKYEYKPEAMTDMFKCRKCNSRSCSYYEVQTRSADEPMTQFISCLDCGSRWRQ